jgi:hypothetical protein
MVGDINTDKLATFTEDLNLRECEQSWSDRRGSFKDLRTYLLVYYSSNNRTLEGFSDQHLESTSPGSIFIITGKGIRTMSKEKVGAVAKEFPVWMLQREQREEFESQFKDQFRHPKRARVISAALPPDLGGSHGEEGLFDTEDSSSSRILSSTGPITGQLVKAGSNDEREILAGGELPNAAQNWLNLVSVVSLPSTGGLQYSGIQRSKIYDRLVKIQRIQKLKKQEQEWKEERQRQEWQEKEKSRETIRRLDREKQEDAVRGRTRRRPYKSLKLDLEQDVPEQQGMKREGLDYDNGIEI